MDELLSLLDTLCNGWPLKCRWVFSLAAVFLFIATSSESEVSQPFLSSYKNVIEHETAKSEESAVCFSFKPFHQNPPLLIIHYWSVCLPRPRKRETKIKRDDGWRQSNRTKMLLPPWSLPAGKFAAGWDWRQGWTWCSIRACVWILRRK